MEHLEVRQLGRRMIAISSDGGDINEARREADTILVKSFFEEEFPDVLLNAEAIEKFIEEEDKKLQKCEELQSRLNWYERFGPFKVFMPGYRKAIIELQEVIKSFRIG